MKIFQVMLAKDFGGAERSFVDITEALTARGHEVIAVVESRSKVRSLVNCQKIYAVKVRSHWDPVAKYQLKNIMRKERPALVHAHLARAAKLAGSAASQLGIPSVVKTHNYVNLKYYRDVNCIVPTTKDQERYLLNAGVAEAKICRIPNFTAMALHDSGAQKKPIDIDEQIHFVALGRLVGKKGFDILLQALSESTLINNFKLTIVGDGEQRNNLETLAAKLNLRSQVVFAGWLNNVSPVLDAADVFVLPSLDEPFGIVVLEAMARAVPIVATKTQGPSEILDDSTAVLVDPGKVSALCEGIELAVSDPAQTAVRALNALALCKARFTKDVVVDRYVALYERLLSPT